MTETYTNESGNELAKNSGWTVNFDRDRVAGDIREETEPHGEPTRYVQLPTEPVDDRDLGVPPACAYCNAYIHISEREGTAIQGALARGETVKIRYHRSEARPSEFGQVDRLDTRTGEGWKFVVTPLTDTEDSTHIVPYDDVLEIVEAPFPDDVGVIRADYAIQGVESGKIHAFACHACVQE